MFRIIVKVLLLSCILQIMCVAAAPRKKGTDEESDEEVSKPNHNNKVSGEDKPLGGFIFKHTRKAFRRIGDFAKKHYNRACEEYRKVNYHESKNRPKLMKVSKKGMEIIIGQKKRVRMMGAHSNAICVRVYNQNLYEQIREHKTKIIDIHGKSKEKYFENISTKIHKCLDMQTTLTFFILEREYRGKREVFAAHLYPGIKAWSVDLNSEDSNEFRNTVQFVERTFLDEKRRLIDYVGELKYHEPKRSFQIYEDRSKKRNKSGNEEEESGEEISNKRKKKNKEMLRIPSDEDLK